MQGRVALHVHLDKPSPRRNSFNLPRLLYRSAWRALSKIMPLLTWGIDFRDRSLSSLQVKAPHASIERILNPSSVALRAQTLRSDTLTTGHPPQAPALGALFLRGLELGAPKLTKDRCVGAPSDGQDTHFSPLSGLIVRAKRLLSALVPVARPKHVPLGLNQATPTYHLVQRRSHGDLPGHAPKKMKPPTVIQVTRGPMPLKSPARG